MNKNFNVIHDINTQVLADALEIFEESFAALDVSKIKLGMARRRLVQNYFENFEKLSCYSISKLIDHISQEI